MASETKTWDDFTPKYRRELAMAVANTIMEKGSTATEAAAFLKQIGETIQRQIGEGLPSILLAGGGVETLTNDEVSKLFLSLGQLREKFASNPAHIHRPNCSMHNLDTAIIASTSLSRQRLNLLGYNVGKKQYQNATQGDTSGENVFPKVGRPSKVNDQNFIDMVGAVLKKYANDSSKVVVVRQSGAKTLACAKLLSKTLWGIWKTEIDLRKSMSRSTFRHISRTHFPSFRKPGRKTDTCSHCRLLKRKIAPIAQAELKKRRERIASFCPEYFHDLDANEEFAASLRDERFESTVVQARRYINTRNANAAQDPLRTTLSLANRAALFDAEARALHKLRGHCELLEAYTWHRTTAARQQNFVTELLQDLSDSEACLHFDFKENVRYPMSKEETGDEWHAQNKLSLTVFGCIVHAPGRRNTHFLLVSEVLDHDSQIARLLLTQILDTITAKEAYQWNKVKTLHLICDCGPHFRSRESYAFFLHDLPRNLKVNVPCLHFSPFCVGVSEILKL